MKSTTIYLAVFGYTIVCIATAAQSADTDSTSYGQSYHQGLGPNNRAETKMGGGGVPNYSTTEAERTNSSNRQKHTRPNVNKGQTIQYSDQRGAGNRSNAGR